MTDTGRIIDAHAHMIVPEVTRDAAPDESWRPKVRWERGRQVIEFGGLQITAAVREIVDTEGILEQQAAAGIGHTLVSPWVNLLRDDVSPAESLRSCRLVNEALAALVERYPGRLSALGAVPLNDPGLAARELEAVMALPGLHGVEITASVRGTYVGDDRFRTFWEAAEGLGALVFIHPTTRGFDSPVFSEYHLWNAVGNPMETTIAAAQMVMAGVMETLPKLKVLLAHAGGMVLWLRGRLRHAHAVVGAARTRLRESPEQSLQRFYFDTITHDAVLLRAALEFAGADHILLGSDYPFDMGMDRPVEFVRSLHLPPDDEAKILGGNTGRLMGLNTVSRDW